MAVTLDNARRNLRIASANVAARQGVDPANLTHEQRRAYNRALAAEILQFPQSFTPEMVTIAENIRDAGPLTSEPSWGDYAGDVLAAGAVASVPVLGGFTDKLLWILALAVVAWIFFNRRPPAASARA